MPSFSKSLLFSVLAFACASEARAFRPRGIDLNQLYPRQNGSAPGSGDTSLQTTFPTAQGNVDLDAPQTIAVGDSFDGGMKQFDRASDTCKGQTEGGDSDAVFLLEDGATLSNVLIGPNNGEGVHCLGTCTLNNVWWVDVCEDAATFKQESGTSFVNGGGAKSGSDKILQHNGGGTVAVKNFFAQTSGKLYRSCGNCETSHARTSTFENIRVEGLGVVAGVNKNFGDKTTISNSCVLDTKSVCDVFDGVEQGSEPTKLSSGADNVNCFITNVKTSGC